MLLVSQLYPYVILGNVLLVALIATVSLLVLYGVVRLAVAHALRSHDRRTQQQRSEPTPTDLRA